MLKTVEWRLTSWLTRKVNREVNQRMQFLVTDSDKHKGIFYLYRVIYASFCNYRLSIRNGGKLDCKVGSVKTVDQKRE